MSAVGPLWSEPCLKVRAFPLLRRARLFTPCEAHKGETRRGGSSFGRRPAAKSGALPAQRPSTVAAGPPSGFSGQFRCLRKN